MVLLSRPRRTSRCSSAFLTLIVLGLTAGSASAQFIDLRTMAGVSPAGDDDGTGTAARFNAPTGVAVDGAGNVYVADQQNCFIRKVTPAGIVTRFAGTIVNNNPCGSTNGASSVAQFSGPNGVAIDGAGNLYVADTFNNKIRKITPAGVVSTLAGSGAFGFADGAGATAQFRSPRGVAVDAAGNVYVADAQNQLIRQVTPGGVVSSVAGQAVTSGSTDGTGTAARFNNPYGIAVDSSGNLYVADSNNHAIRKIANGGTVTTLAGGMFGNQDGTGVGPRFNGPRGVAVDGAGTVYVADTGNQRIRQVTAAGVVTTLAGSFRIGGFDGPVATARFNNPEGIAVDAAGVVYVADTTSDTIRKIASGTVTTLAGFVGSFGSADGEEQAARFGLPAGVALDSNRTLYIADRNNSTIRKISPAGVVTTFAGLADNSGNVDGTGSAARFGSPSGVAVDSSGTAYVFDTGYGTIRKITPDGVVTTLAGDGTYGHTDGTGSAARFSSQGGIAVDRTTGMVYVADALSNSIRKVTPGGVVTTIAGSTDGLGGNADGIGNAARFSGPWALAVDAAGVLYIADRFNHTIRKMTPDGTVTTIAGTAGSVGSQDGTGAAARFNNPQGIAVDSAGTIYVADTNNHIIRSITSGNVVTKISGCTGCFGGESWGRFNQPVGIAVDTKGFLYVADSRNNSIRTTAPLGTSLVADFGSAYGIWLRRGTTWRQVHSFTAKSVVAIRENSGEDGLIVDFGPGVGIWFYIRDADGTDFWFQIHYLSADAMAGLDTDGNGDTDSGVFSFAGLGLWFFDGDHGTWSQLHGANPIHLASGNLDGVGGDELIADFAGYGLWVYSAGAWSQLHGSSVSTMMTADLDGNGKQDLIADFAGYGVWAYMNRTTWERVHPYAAQRLASADLDGNGVTDLVVDFGASVGLWARKNGTTWVPLHYLTTESIVGGDLDGDGLDEVIADFGAAGVWSYQEGRGWAAVHSFNPKSIVTGRLR